MERIPCGLPWGKIGTNPYSVFKEKASYKKFEKLFSFETLEEEDGIVYSAYEVTLYPVPEGNARAEDILERNFPKPQ